MKIYDAKCPVCGQGPGTLWIENRMVASPLGSFSLAGVQLKVSARMTPVLLCISCGMDVPGQYDDDKSHVYFDPKNVSYGPGGNPNQEKLDETPD